MKKLIFEYDENSGRLINSYVMTEEEYETEKIKKNLTDIVIADGFYIPKFNGVGWVEDITEEEKNKLNKREPSELEKIKKELQELKDRIADEIATIKTDLENLKKA